MLKFLSEHKVELASAVFFVVESPAPIDAEQTEHGQIDSQADAGRAFQVERVEFFEIAPAVTRFDECQCPDVGLSFQQNRVAQFHGEARVEVAVVVAVGAVFLPILAVCINIPGPDNGSDSGAVAHLAGTCQCINLGGRSCRRMSCLAGISLRVGVADIVTDRIQPQPVCIDTIYHGIESGKGTLHVVSPALKYLSRYAG